VPTYTITIFRTVVVSVNSVANSVKVHTVSPERDKKVYSGKDY